MLSKLGMTMLAYRVYIFQFFSLSIQIMCVIIPLIKVYMTKFKSDEGRVKLKSIIYIYISYNKKYITHTHTYIYI